ncbi:MAG: hypothetical protein IJ215_02690 [Clostridia bacterium]|nr:hypothetical protein [Clostridia bacterium]
MIRTGSAVGNYAAKCVREDNRDKIAREHMHEKYMHDKNAFYDANKEFIDAVMYVELPKKFKDQQKFLDQNLFETWRHTQPSMLPQLSLAFSRMLCILERMGQPLLSRVIVEYYKEDEQVQKKLQKARDVHP